MHGRERKKKQNKAMVLEVVVPYLDPTPWHLAEKANVSLTVISPI